MKNIFCMLLCIFNMLIAAAMAEVPAYTEKETVISVSLQQPEFVLKLSSNPTTGYAWFLREYNHELVQPIKRVMHPSADHKLIGAGGTELWTFRVKPEAFHVPQALILRLAYERPWQTDEEPTELVFKIFY